MRMTVGFLALCLLGGCAFVPPKPKQCEGEFRPVNQPVSGQSTASLTLVERVAMCTTGGAYGHQVG
jgi:hypothetical protein